VSLKLYFLRSGETVYNQIGAYCGERDPELTVEGTHPLFARTSRAVALTHAGEAMLERARHILKRVAVRWRNFHQNRRPR
jgi:broad specificity phosphatase PhoE